MSYSDEQREYWTKRPANVIRLLTVQFYHPDFGYIRLVANQFCNKELDVDGDLQEFQAVAMEVPEVTAQSTDSTQAGSISFGRIGTTVREKLMSITPLNSILYPINVRVSQYEDGSIVYDRNLYAAPEGIAINNNSVNIQMTVDNPAKLTNEQKFYAAADWPGLEYS